jgi:hypothetical protein
MASWNPCHVRPHLLDLAEMRDGGLQALDNDLDPTSPTAMKSNRASCLTSDGGRPPTPALTVGRTG